MKKIVSLFAVVLAGLSFSQAQNGQTTVLDGAYVKDHNLTRKPVPFTPLREADVAWGKKIWRVINIDEKINLPLKYPEQRIRDRRNLITIIMDAIKEGSLTAYNRKNDEFLFPMTAAEADLIGIPGGNRFDTVTAVSPDPPYNEIRVPKENIFETAWVNGYKVKEDWFFDKQRSMMDVRILGIAPMWFERGKGNVIQDSSRRAGLFWVYYPEARQLFANNETFNRFNDTERKTFDDVFMKRIFSSYVVKESNVYDRAVEEYKTNGLDALLEADNIKEQMFIKEHDLWEY